MQFTREFPIISSRHAIQLVNLTPKLTNALQI